MAPGDDVVVAAQLAVGRGGLQQPALQAGAVHGGDGPAAAARPLQPLGRRAAEADAADVLGRDAVRHAGHLLRRRRLGSLERLGRQFIKSWLLSDFC